MASEGANPSVGPAPAAATAAQQIHSSSPALSSREDARRQIREIVKFMETIEPSHPAPMLLKRADRLMGMTFYEIIRDIAPGAVADVERIAGIEPTDE